MNTHTHTRTRTHAHTHVRSIFHHSPSIPPGHTEAARGHGCHGNRAEDLRRQNGLISVGGVGFSCSSPDGNVPSHPDVLFTHLRLQGTASSEKRALVFVR